MVDQYPAYILDGYGTASANIKDLVIGFIPIHHDKVRLNHILYMDEIPGLPSIFKNHQRFTI